MLSIAAALKFNVDKEITGMLELAEEGTSLAEAVLEMFAEIDVTETEIADGRLRQGNSQSKSTARGRI